MKKYVLTGGPGSGKSSVLLELERRGHPIIREAAEDVIKLAQAKGDREPWKNPSFQREIFNLQKQREANAPEGAFIDRGLLDGLAYLPQADLEGPLAKQIYAASSVYAGVFLMQQSMQTRKKPRSGEEQSLSLRSRRFIVKICGLNI